LTGQTKKKHGNPRDRRRVHCGQARVIQRKAGGKRFGGRGKGVAKRLHWVQVKSINPKEGETKQV